jgi:hypothetical protein
MAILLPHEARLMRSRHGDRTRANALWDAIRSEAGTHLQIVKTNDRGFTAIGDLPISDGSCMPVVLKTWRILNATHVAKLAAGQSQAQRQWRGAELLESAGIPTSNGLALWRGRDDEGALLILLLEKLPGEDVISLLHHQRFTAEHARAIGELTATLAISGIYNRDHKPSNLIALPDGRIGVVDTVGVRRRRALSPDPKRSGALSMLVAQVIESLGVGLLPSRSNLLRGLQAFADAYGLPRRDLKQAWRDLRRITMEHGDPTPKDDPRPAAQSA